MRNMFKPIFLVAMILSLTSSSEVLAKSKGKKGEGNSNGEGVSAEAGSTPKSSRERNIIREGRQKKGDKSKIDFEATDISGQRKLPLGSLVNQNKPDKEYDFVKLRWQWHPEMVQSASSLEGGRIR